MEEKHFFVVHTFVSDEARKAYLTPQEKREPPQKRETEREWGSTITMSDEVKARIDSLWQDLGFES